MSDKEKAPAFIQENATVNGQMSDRSSRRTVRELRSGVRRLLGSPLLEHEQTYSPEKLAAAQNTVKTGKAGGHDGVAPDLIKHLPLNTQKELLSILIRDLYYGMVPTGLWNSDDCPVFNERERPTSCEQLSNYCSYVHHREIA